MGATSGADGSRAGNRAPTAVRAASGWRAGLSRGLFTAAAVLGALGLGVEAAYHRLRRESLRPLVAFFSLSFEHNLPTWYASSLLLACAVALGAVATRVGREPGAPFRRHWWGLAVIFAYMSLDEAVCLHENLGGLLALHGVLYFSWIVPAAALLALFGLSYLRFVARLPPGTRRRFVTAGLVYVGGALVMELPLGFWAERAGDDNFVYAAIDWVEEMLELAGASLFLLAVLRHLGELPRRATAGATSDARGAPAE